MKEKSTQEAEETERSGVAQRQRQCRNYPPENPAMHVKCIPYKCSVNIQTRRKCRWSPNGNIDYALKRVDITGTAALGEFVGSHDRTGIFVLAFVESIH